MTKEVFQTYIHQHIPITGAMDIHVEEYSPESIILRASLNPNINHRESAFGGSISSLLIMAGWSRVYKLLQDQGLKGTIVIQKSHVEFLSPVTTDFRASADAIDSEEVSRFLRTFHKFGKARLELSAGISEGGRGLARFQGSFVVIR